MTIRNSQDFAAGLFFIAVGAAAWWIGIDYSMGTARTPGTGVLPRIIAWCLIATGLVLAGKALAFEGPRLTAWALRPLAMITLAVVAFALLIDRLGLVATMLVSMTLTALGTPETRWREFMVFAAAMVALGVGLFVLALGMPIKMTPWPDIDQAIFRFGRGMRTMPWR